MPRLSKTARGRFFCFGSSAGLLQRPSSTFDFPPSLQTFREDFLITDSWFFPFAPFALAPFFALYG